jgi:hypothetical protein
MANDSNNVEFKNYNKLAEDLESTGMKTCVMM